MLGNRVWARVVGVDRRTVIEGVEFDEAADVVVVAVRRRRPGKQRCGLCGRVAGGYDQGGGRRRWRALDLGVVRVVLEAVAPRVSCRDHGVVVAQVPWARHGAGHTRAFDDTVAWLVTQASKSATSELLRVSWRTVGSIVDRVVADLDRHIDRFDGLRRIGIDEISYKRGHRYLTVVVDHDSGRLVWAAPGTRCGNLGRILRASRPPAMRVDPSCLRRRGALDRRQRGSLLPERPAGRDRFMSSSGPTRPSTRSAATCGTASVEPICCPLDAGLGPVEQHHAHPVKRLVTRCGRTPRI